MERYLEGKKILILGGSSNMVNVVKVAQSMGCVVYVTDYYDTFRSPAKLAADHYADISIEDYSAIVEYINNNHIDGVITGYTDSYLKHYLNICELAGLPHYGSMKSFGVATDKMLFKNACIKAGVGVIPGCNAYDFETVLAFAEKNGFPLMLKPTDNSGSRGVIKCEALEELQSCYDYALSFSPSKNVIVERYMDCDSVGVVYQFAGKKAKLVAMCDRDTYSSREDGSAIVSCTRYPSRYLERYKNEADQAMLRLFEENDFCDGMVSPMAFVDENGFYMCEMCYRPSGGNHFTLINDQNGVNGLALLIEFAVTGKTSGYRPEQETPCFKDCCGMIHILGKPNQEISRISGVEAIRALEGVIDVQLKLREGQKIGKDGTTAQKIMSVWIKAKNWNDFDTLAERIKRMLVVEDKSGCSLISTM